MTLPNPGDQSGTEGVAPSLSPDASDANAGASFSWSETDLPAGLSIVPATARSPARPTPATAGVTRHADGHGRQRRQRQPDLRLVRRPRRHNQPTPVAIRSRKARSVLSFCKSGHGRDRRRRPASAKRACRRPEHQQRRRHHRHDQRRRRRRRPLPATITATDGTYSASQDVVWIVAPAVAVTDPGPQSTHEGDPCNAANPATDSTGAAPTFSRTGLLPDLSISSERPDHRHGHRGHRRLLRRHDHGHRRHLQRQRPISWDVADRAGQHDRPRSRSPTPKATPFAANDGDGRRRPAARATLSRRPARPASASTRNGASPARSAPAPPASTSPRSRPPTPIRQRRPRPSHGPWRRP